MYDFSIGVLADSFRTDFATSLSQARECGAKGVQIYATSGPMSPENLNAARRRQVVAMVEKEGMAISALCGDLGQGFADAEKNPGLIERSRRILDLAVDLGVEVVTTHIGVVPQDAGHPRYAVMQRACRELGRHAAARGVCFAIETGPETAATLKAFLDSLGTEGINVNLDPANLVMVTGDDPVRAVYTLREYIVHTHAKDGRRLMACDPENIYSTRPVEEVVREGKSFVELPLGEGDVDWPRYLEALDEIGYSGYLTIEREVGDDPEADIRRAVVFLEQLLVRG